jgi:hypothetical protein
MTKKMWNPTKRKLKFKKNFVDPRTGVHTNNIESTWKTCKMKIKQMCGNTVQLIRLIFGYIISLFPI